MDKTTALPPLLAKLRQTLSEPGCPLCRLSADAEKAYIDSLNYERVLDLKTRDALKASRGLCAAHSRQWQNLQGSALSVAIVYRVAVLDLLRDTDPAATKGGFLRQDKGPGQMAQRLESSGVCLACEQGAEAAQRFADELIKDLGAEETQNLLRECGGLCLPHLRMALRRPGAGKTHKLLLEAQRAAWQALMADVEEFIRKNDYRFRQEKLSDAEADSWIRAVDALVGRE
ncbi:MAG: hypothetical protein JXA21_26490 [Anaerolineae bacterium]|nr:hypothetical protein [Anaerolineae bacterium]